MNILYLIANPEKFFKKLKNDNDYKKHFLFLFIISVSFYIHWFSKVLLNLNNQHLNEQEISIYSYFFDSLNIKFIYYLIIFLIVDVFIVYIFTIILSILLKGICYLLNINLSFRNLLKITIYSLTPTILTLFITLFFYISNWQYVPFYIQYFPDLLVLFLLIIGIKTTSNSELHS